MRITIIGAGPGGYEAAIHAAKRGHEVTLIERRELGGTCLNRGCIPTKALLAASDNLAHVAEAKSYGIEVPEGAKADFAAILARKDSIVKLLTQGIEHLMKQNGVTVVQGSGFIRDAHHVEVETPDGGTQTIEGDKIIIATGSKPSVPPVFTVDGETIITSDEVLALAQQPKSMIIIGGGVIGCEIAQFFARLGTEITILEMMPHILPNEDADTVKPLERRFRRERIKTVCGKGVEAIEKTADGVTVKLSDGAEHVGEIALISIGRRPVTDGIGIENINATVGPRGHIEVNEFMQTGDPDVYAIGDIVPTAQLAHVATYEGFVAVDHISGDAEPADYRAVPRCVYTSPEVASVGITEADAEKSGTEITVGRFDFMGLGKAKASGHTDGMAKIIAGADGKVLGGALTGSSATEMIQTLTLAVKFGLTVDELKRTIFPHPSMSEGILEALRTLGH